MPYKDQYRGREKLTKKKNNAMRCTIGKEEILMDKKEEITYLHAPASPFCGG